MTDVSELKEIAVLVENTVMWDDFVRNLHADATMLPNHKLIDGDHVYFMVLVESSMTHRLRGRNLYQIQRYMCSFPNNRVADEIKMLATRINHPKPCIYVECR